MCVVTEPLICQFWLSAPDYECRVNRSDVTCSIYVVHISPEMNGGLNSRQTATSFHPSRSLSLAYLFAFFICHTKNHATYFHRTNQNLEHKIIKQKINIIFDVTQLPHDSPIPSSQHYCPRYPTQIYAVYINNSFKIKIVQDIKL